MRQARSVITGYLSAAITSLECAGGWDSRTLIHSMCFPIPMLRVSLETRPRLERLSINICVYYIFACAEPINLAHEYSYESVLVSVPLHVCRIIIYIFSY